MMPAISQCPVVVSFPGEASAAFPNAAVGRSTGFRCGKGLMLASPMRCKLGMCSGRTRSRLPRVSLPGASPYAAASGISPTPQLSRTIRMTRSNEGMTTASLSRPQGHLFRGREVVRDLLRHLSRGGPFRAALQRYDEAHAMYSVAAVSQRGMENAALAELDR